MKLTHKEIPKHAPGRGSDKQHPETPPKPSSRKGSSS